MDVNNHFVPQRFFLAYVEFDDQGEFWSIGNERQDRAKDEDRKSQIEKAVDLVKEQRQIAIETNRGLRVLGFVHGWQNNASPQDELKVSGRKNLASFKNSLQFLSENCAQEEKNKDGECPIVIGIFFAWRGRTIPVYGLHAITYRDRRDAANHVGGPSMTEAVMLLALATKGSPASYDPGENCAQVSSATNPRKAEFWIVGHSFGGRALEHGVTQPLLAILLERKAQAEDCLVRWKAKNHEPGAIAPIVKITSPLDLIALVNPANDALEAKSMIEAFKRSGLGSENFDHPFIISIKSAGDSATGWVMWAGQSIAAERPPQRDYDRAPKPAPSACEQGQLGLHPQSFYYRRSAGGIYSMASHQLSTTEDDPKKAKPPFDDPVTCKAYQDSSSNNDHFFWGGITPTGSGGRCFRVRTVKDILKEDDGHYAEAAKKYYSCRPEYYDGKNKPVPAWNDTPYFVVNAPSSFIRDHDDIFQRGLFNFLELMVDGEKPVVIKSSPVSMSATVSTKDEKNNAMPDQPNKQ